MEGIKLWLAQNLGMNEGEIIGAGIIVAACILVCGITYLKRKLGILGGFLIRAGAGTGLICLGNYVLSLSGISLAVGVGPVSVLTCAILGIPGVFLMYGIMLI